MIKLLTFWAAYRLLRAVSAIVVIATLALLLLDGAHPTARHGVRALRSLQHAGRPLEQQLQHALQKGFRP